MSFYSPTFPRSQDELRNIGLQIYWLSQTTISQKIQCKTIPYNYWNKQYICFIRLERTDENPHIFYWTNAYAYWENDKIALFWAEACVCRLNSKWGVARQNYQCYPNVDPSSTNCLFRDKKWSIFFLVYMSSSSWDRSFSKPDSSLVLLVHGFLFFFLTNCIYLCFFQKAENIWREQI